MLRYNYLYADLRAKITAAEKLVQLSARIIASVTAPTKKVMSV